MVEDCNVKKLRNNCFRQSKVLGEFMLQLRAPGAVVDAKWLTMIQHVCETWGNGQFRLGARQTLNAPGVKARDIPAVNAYIQPYLEAIERDVRRDNQDENRATIRMRMRRRGDYEGRA